MPSPARSALTGTPASIGADPAARLATTHEQRIQQLASRLQASLLDAACERDLAQTIAPQRHSALLGQDPSPQLSSRSGPISRGAVNLTEVFDELIACDQANRLNQLMQDTNFKDRELQRLREALAGSQQECSWVQQKQAAAEEALSKAAGASSALQSELRSLQASHDTQQQQLQSLSAAKATAESAAVVAGSRIAALEAQLGSKSTELDQVQLQYKRLLGEQQVELERLRQQLQQQGSELGKLQTSAAQKEQGLLQQLHSFSGSLQDIRASHAADKATAEQLQKQVEQLQRELQDGRASKQQAEASAKQLEGLLADSEAERRTLRAKYISLGDKLEALVAEEAAQAAAAAEAAQQAAASSAQLAEAQQALIDADRLHLKAVKKLERRVQSLAADHDAARQELLIKTAELLDVQTHLREAEGRQQLQQEAACEQMERLQLQVVQLQEQLEAAAVQEEHVRLEAQAAAQERFDIQLQQQQLKCDRQVQELELAHRYLSTVDALLAASPGGSSSSRHLAAAASLAGSGGLERTSPSGAVAAAAAAAAASDSIAAAGLGGLFPGLGSAALEAHIRRNFEGQAEAHLDAEVLSVRRELSAEYKRRLDALDADWAARASARSTELEAAHAFKVQQLEHTAKLERERLEASFADVTAAKQRLADQLASAQQELSRVSAEAGQLRMAMEEARAAAEEARRVRASLQAQLDDAGNSIQQLQATLARTATGAAGEREMVADLMNRLELRTAERNDAQAAANAAEARAKALEVEKQQAASTAEAAKAAIEARLRAVTAEAAEATETTKSAQAALERKVARLKEELEAQSRELSEVRAVRGSVEAQLSASRAEVTTLTTQLAELRGSLAAARDSAVVAEAAAARLQEERVRLSKSVAELEAARGELGTQAATAAGEVARLSVALQELAQQRVGLAHKLTVVEAEKDVAVRTSILRASTASPTAPGPSLLCLPVVHSSPAATGRISQARSPSLSPAPPDTSTSNVRSSMAYADAGVQRPNGFGSFAGFRASALLSEALPGLCGAAAAPAHSGYSEKDLEGLLGAFDEERQVMGERYTAAEGRATQLQAQVGELSLRCNDLAELNHKLLAQLEQQQGQMQQESKAAAAMTKRIMADVQHSNNEVAALNAHMQNELEACRKAHQSALESAGASEQRALATEAKLSEAQRSHAAAVQQLEATHTEAICKAKASHAAAMSKVQTEAEDQLSRLKQQLQQLRTDVQTQLAKQKTEEAAKRKELEERHSTQVQQQAAEAEAALQAAKKEAAALLARYESTIGQLQQLLEQQGGAAGVQLAELHAQAEDQQQHLVHLTHQLLSLLQLPQQQQRAATGALVQHQTYAASAAAAAAGTGGPGSIAGSPLRRGSIQPQQQLQQQQQWPVSPAASGTWSPSKLSMQQQQQQHKPAGLPADVYELCQALCGAVGVHSQPEEVANALEALVSGLTQALLVWGDKAAGLEAALAEAQTENEQLLADGTVLAGDFQACASNLQSLVATLALCVTLGEELQLGLNARDQAVFDEQLVVLPEVLLAHMEAEKAAAAAAVTEGPLAAAEAQVAALQAELDAAQGRLAELVGQVEQLRRQQQEEHDSFEAGLHRARKEATEGAELAFQESLSALKGELTELKSQLSSLQDAHTAQLSSQQEAAARQLAQQLKTADTIIKELEGAAVSLQNQLAAEVDRADGYSRELQRLAADKERNAALEARKDRRQTGEIEGLRERLRAMESREKEKEEELKNLKRSLRNKELSLLSGAGGINGQGA